MTAQQFRQEIQFGLENLEKVRSDINAFQSSPADAKMRDSALEHLVIRVLKPRGVALPTGPTSHQMILNTFQDVLAKLNIAVGGFDALKRLLGFRHVATKIYGFLIDEASS